MATADKIIPRIIARGTTLATQGGSWLRQHFNAWCYAGKNSLRLRLLAFFGGGLLVVWCVTALIAWYESSTTIDEFFDTQQMLFAQRLAAGNLPLSTPPRPSSLLELANSPKANMKKKPWPLPCSLILARW
ncbi:MAG: hypothetical protein HY916_11415 [Desulfovibrio sp.]|nr:hypothetical protein [Desulfovibrio sp.]